MKAELSLELSQQTPVVFLVDDDISIRESLDALISFEGLHTETFSSAKEFLARSRQDGPSCLILDVSLPDLNGLDLQNILTDDQNRIPIIFITGHGDIPMTVRAMKAGAVEFLTKPINDEALLTAVRHAIDRSRASLENETEIGNLRDRYASLTPREREVMALVVAGLLNKQVGYKLGISEITVKAHRGKIMQKMMADSVAELVRQSISLRLTPVKNPWRISHDT